MSERPKIQIWMRSEKVIDCVLIQFLVKPIFFQPFRSAILFTHPSKYWIPRKVIGHLRLAKINITFNEDLNVLCLCLLFIEVTKYALNVLCEESLTKDDQSRKKLSSPLFLVLLACFLLVTVYFFFFYHFYPPKLY